MHIRPLVGLASFLTLCTSAATLSAQSGHVHDATPAQQPSQAPRGLIAIGGGTVIQILPGPFPFADSAAAIIAARPAAQQADLRAKLSRGPYSNAVARITGTARFTVWDRDTPTDSIDGRADVITADGAHWRLVVDRVQTVDQPFNPRFGGVILGLVYHGATGSHTPLVPTIKSAVALWGIGHLFRNNALVTEEALVHVMLLSRTRRPTDFALMCWTCTANPVDELQLQITPAPGQPPFDAPGGVLFVNWNRSTGRPLASRPR